jgi:hypothetical protein
VTSAVLVSPFVGESWSWGGSDEAGDQGKGDGDADAEAEAEAEAEADKDAGVEDVRPANAGGGTAATGVWEPFRTVFAAAFSACVMDLEAAVTSCVKFSGPLTLVATGLSCLVDHCRRC